MLAEEPLASVSEPHAAPNSARSNTDAVARKRTLRPPPGTNDTAREETGFVWKAGTRTPGSGGWRRQLAGAQSTAVESSWVKSDLSSRIYVIPGRPLLEQCDLGRIAPSDTSMIVDGSEGSIRGELNCRRIDLMLIYGMESFAEYGKQLPDLSACARSDSGPRVASALRYGAAGNDPSKSVVSIPSLPRRSCQGCRPAGGPADDPPSAMAAVRPSGAMTAPSGQPRGATIPSVSRATRLLPRRAPPRSSPIGGGGPPPCSRPRR